MNRIRCLFNEMFSCDIRHYVATLLHPKYRSLKLCSKKERSACHAYVRQQLKLIHIELNEPDQQQIDKPLHKKFKKDLFSRFESSNFGADEESEEESEEEIEAVSSGGKKLTNLIVILI